MSVTGRLRALVGDGTLGYLLTLSRPRFWLYLAGPALVGAVFAAETPAGAFAPRIVALMAYFLVPANVFLYGVNDAFDAEADELNPKKEDREARYRGGRGPLLLALACGALGLAALPALPPASGAAMVGFLALGLAYSVPPVRFKARPFLDSLSNGLYVLPGVVTYAAVAGDLPPVLGLAGGWLWTMGMHTFSAIPDVEADRAAGIQTTATALGESRTYAYCAVVWALAALAFAGLHPALGALLAVYPAFVAWLARADVAVDRAYWWFPIVNTAVGTLLTMAGIWRLVDGL